MKKWAAVMVAGLTAVLAGCGDEPISIAEAKDIAAMSQDADKYLEEFASAIRELSTEDTCQASYMKDFGGFWRDSDGPYYFIHCGTLYSENNVKTWYYDPLSDTLSRFEYDLQ